jgi:hypothetical protein
MGHDMKRKDTKPTDGGQLMPRRLDPAALEAALPNLSPAERERVAFVAAKATALCAGPEMALKLSDGTLTISYRHDDPMAATALIMADVGTCDPAFFAGLSGHIASIGAQGRTVDETASNFLLSVARAVKPRDELEALLAVQMGAIHTATMMMARRLNHVETIPQQDSAERALNKLARTYATQLEALKRYRTGGQQKVIVEHVTVNAGGQAIVGAVEHGGGGQE